MCIQISRVTDIVTVLLQPTNEVELVCEKLAAAVVIVGPVKRHLHSPGGSAYGVWPIAVEIVEALAGSMVIGVVVVRLIRRDTLLIQQFCVARIVADNEVDIILVALRVRELH